MSIRQSLQLRFYFGLSIVLFLLFALVDLLILMILDLIQGSTLFLLLLQIVGCLIVAFIGWLVDRGSNGDNREIVIKLIGGFAGMSYSGVLGMSIGPSISSTFGRVALSSVIIVFGVFVGIRLGPVLSNFYFDRMGRHGNSE